MNAVLILLFLALVAMAVILPIAAMVRAAAAQRSARELSARLRALERQLDQMREKSQQAAAPVAMPVPAPAAATPPVPAASHRPALPPPLPDRPVPQSHGEPKVTELAAARRPDPLPTGPVAAPAGEAATRPAASPRTSPSRTPAFNWERFMGVRLFAWLGGFALFLAAAFFVKYSFEHGWVPPWLRVTAGFVLGAGLVVGGFRMSQKRYKVTADTLCATGVVILYAVTFACRAIYEFPFFSVLPTFALMTVITATAFLLAVRLNAMVVAVLGMLGGFLTPVLVNSGQDNPLGLFGYVLLLDLGLLAVARVRRWDWLNFAAALGTVVMQFGWLSRFYTVGKVFTGMCVFLGFCAVFSGANAWARRVRTTNLWLIGAGLLAAASAAFFALVIIAESDTGTRPGIVFGHLLGADLAVLALAILHGRRLSVPADRGEKAPTQATIPGLAWLSQLAGGAVFILLAIWISLRVEQPLLYRALAGVFGFALLHTLLPLLMQRRHPHEPVPAAVQLFPIVALLVTLVPLLKFETMSYVVWPLVLLIDVLAILLAVATASVSGILLALLVTVVLAFVWLTRAPMTVEELPGMLVVLGGTTLVFCVAGVFAGRRITDRIAGGSQPGDAAFWPAGWLPADVQRQIPALSALFPFLLLMMVTGQVPLADPSPVFTFGLGLVVLLLGLARVVGMTWLPAVALGAAFMLEHIWHARHFTSAGAAIGLGWHLLFYAVFALFPFVVHRGDGSKVVAWAASALSGPLHFWLVYETVRRAWPNEYMGVVPALFALPALAGVVMTARQIPGGDPCRNAILAWFGGVTLFLVTLIFPIQFEKQWLTIAWALEGAALLWLFRRVPHRALPALGLVLLVVSFVRLALNPEIFGYHARSAVPVFNWYLYTYGLVIAALFAGARLVKPEYKPVLNVSARPLLVTLGTILAFILLNIEIADYFTPAGRGRLVFSFTGNFARDMTYTIGWALFAFVLLVAGIRRRVRPARWAGIALLVVTLLKLFLHDLAALGQLYRVGALVGVAVVAIVASFLYQKFLGGDDALPDPGGDAR